MEGKDYEIIGEGIVIRTAIPILSVTEMEIDQQENTHGLIRIHAQTQEESAEEIYHTDWSGSRILVYKKDEPDTPMFHGSVFRMLCYKENRLMELEIEGVSGSAELDRERRKRSFQNGQMTYKQVIKKVLEGNKNAGFIWTLGDDRAIGSPLIQYEETDWEFLKRIGSHFHSVVIPDMKTGKAEFFLGMPKGMERNVDSAEILKEGFRNIYDEEAGSNGRMSSKFVCEMDVITRENWQLGDFLIYQGQRYRAFRKRIVFESGELVFFYRLGTEGACWREKTYHKLLAGLRLEGTIQKTREESVSISLDMDGGTGGDYFWPWAPETNNLCYCMPEAGTKAVLYFPTQEEKDGVVVLAAVKNGNNSRYNDPQNREFVTAYHKKTGLYPDRLVMEGADSAVTLSMDDLSGISLYSNSSISLQAAGKVSVKGKTVSVTAPMEIDCRTKEANIEISRDLNFYAPAGIRTVGTEDADGSRKTGAEEKAGGHKPEHWQLSYRAMGAVPAVDLTAIQDKNDIADFFACGSVPKVAKGSTVIALSEVMKGKREKETSFPRAFRSMENYVVKGAHAMPLTGVGSGSSSLPEALEKGVKGLGILDGKGPGSAGENGAESCSCKVHVMCTRASGGCNIHVKKDGEIIKSESSVCGLTREDIELECDFAGCVTGDGEVSCAVVEGGWIEDGLWQQFGDESGSTISETPPDASDEVSEAEGRALALDSAYMVCTKGFGLIYFEEYGQEMKEAWDRLNKYVSPETFTYMNSRWDIDVFKRVYGNDIFERMIRLMFRAGIIEEVSICAFLATIGTESWYGQRTTEYEPTAKTYTDRTKGVGLMQVTGLNQKIFIEWLLQSGWEQDEQMRYLLNEYRKNYTGEGTEANPNDNECTEDGGKSAAEFLAAYYAVEISIWYWAHFDWGYYHDINDLSHGNLISPNNYVIRFAIDNPNVDNVFLAASLHVNQFGDDDWSDSRRQKIAMERTNKYRIDPLIDESVARIDEHEVDNTQYYMSFEEDGQTYRGKVSRNWGQRYHDWVKLKELW